VLRVIQWATNNVGRHAAAAIHRHPDLELVGALVYSDAKAGRDVGDICGLGPIGVTATTDRDAVVHAIAPVCAADPGIRTFLDLPMITGRGILG